MFDVEVRLSSFFFLNFQTEDIQMTRLYLLTKRKNKTNWQIDNLKPGISKVKVKQLISKERRPGYQFKILSDNGLAKFLLQHKPKK